MKKIWYAICIFIANTLLLSGQSWAATPTDINYCAKGKTAFGTKFTTYNVRCSNGKKEQITAWDQRTKWCVGNASTSNCFNDQLKAARKACE